VGGWVPVGGGVPGGRSPRGPATPLPGRSCATAARCRSSVESVTVQVSLGIIYSVKGERAIISGGTGTFVKGKDQLET